MSSHWSAVGFQEDPQEVFSNYAGLGFQHGTPVKTPQGSYVRWQCGTGVELWFQRFGENSVNMNPHFAGETRIKVQLTYQFQRPDEPPLDGAFYGLVRVQLTDEPFDVPFLFDSPDFLVHGQKPVLTSEDTHIQVAAFVHSIKVWPDEAAFLQSHVGERRLSPLSYFPRALPDEDDPYPPAIASFGGIIDRSDLLTNPITGNTFWCAQARTLIGQIDLVADPNDLPDEGVQAGNAFWATCYLSGLIHEAE